jgi:hypothetical protein
MVNIRRIDQARIDLGEVLDTDQFHDGLHLGFKHWESVSKPWKD